MNKLDLDYQNLLKDILENGISKSDRTGTGTISIFGRQIRHSMKDGFPLLTTKKMAWKTMVTELLWFLRGDTNVKYLLENDCYIWTGDAVKNYEKHNGEIQCGPHITKQEYFEDLILTDDEFAEEWGELGPIYGKQWRQWQGWMDIKDAGTNAKGSLWYDQIAVLIHQLKTNPDSRRLMVNAWNVGELDQMVLPPCHYGFQVYTRELSKGERMDYWFKNHKPNRDVCDSVDESSEEEQHKYFDDANVPKRAISLMFNMRSTDVGLGLPFNIASYGLLLEIIAKEVNMVPDELIGNLGDAHIYLNQIEGVKEQLTREPMPLPTLKIEGNEPSIIEKPQYWKPADFVIENYKSHPTIKMPLSN